MCHHRFGCFFGRDDDYYWDSREVR
ncbi:unnamed protein product, partial [Allacma fusca]